MTKTVTTNNTFTQAISFISIYSFWGINSIQLQHLLLTQASIYVFMVVDSICCPQKKTDLTTIIMLYNSSVFSEESHHPNWVWFWDVFHHIFITISLIIDWSNKMLNFLPQFPIPFLSLVAFIKWTSDWYLLRLCSSMYPFTLLIIEYKLFMLFGVT